MWKNFVFDFCSSAFNNIIYTLLRYSFFVVCVFHLSFIFLLHSDLGRESCGLLSRTISGQRFHATPNCCPLERAESWEELGSAALICVSHQLVEFSSASTPLSVGANRQTVASSMSFHVLVSLCILLSVAGAG